MQDISVGKVVAVASSSSLACALGLVVVVVVSELRFESSSASSASAEASRGSFLGVEGPQRPIFGDFTFLFLLWRGGLVVVKV